MRREHTVITKNPLSIRNRKLLLASMFFLCVLPVHIALAGISVGLGSSMSLGSGSVDAGCGDVTVNGTLNLNSGDLTGIDNVGFSGTIDGDTGSMSLGGDWTNNGLFIPDSSSISLVDECGDGAAEVHGDSNFNNLSIVTNSGKTVGIESGSETNVAGDLVLTGTAGNLLTLVGIGTNAQWVLELSQFGTQLVDYVAVGNGIAIIPGQHMAPGAPTSFNSINLGNNFRWFTNNLFVPIPTLSEWGMILLIAALLLGTGMRRRKGSIV